MPDDKAAEFNREDAAALGKPAGVTFARIKADELKLSENPIPPSVLAAILPILDQ